MTTEELAEDIYPTKHREDGYDNYSQLFQADKLIKANTYRKEGYISGINEHCVAFGEWCRDNPYGAFTTAQLFEQYLNSLNKTV
jgi:hypothetical protein